MKTQKEVQLISFELKDYRIIRAVKLDFEKWKNENILEIVGDIGNGKSSLLEGIEMATTGVEHIKDKDLLNLGFKSEVQLADGNHKIFLGVKVSEISRGERKGEPKFETYIYEKDDNGKLISNPVIDGKKATAKEYTKLLSTALTFNMKDMFSENQTTHRKLIESLFSEELNKLGVETVLTKIKAAREDRDYKRHERDRAAATMESFKEMGYDENKLEKLTVKSTFEVENKIKELEIEKEILLKNPEKEKESKLIEIKNKGKDITAEIEKLNNQKEKEYSDRLFQYKEKKGKLLGEKKAYEYILEDVKRQSDVISESFIKSVEKLILIEVKNIQEKIYQLGISPTQPEIIDVKNLPDVIPGEYKSLIDAYKEISKEYTTVKNSETNTPNTSDVDNKINQLKNELEFINNNNELANKYQLWKNWVEASGIYEREVENLRKLYTKIETGVKGLKIMPNITNSGKLEIWFEYNGEHDTELFKNKTRKYRRLYEYSKSQGAIIGILLQSSRLDKKDKVLRLVVLDDATQTKAGKKLLWNICKEKNLKLIIAKTSDEYDISNLSDGTIAIENGEILM